MVSDFCFKSLKVNAWVWGCLGHKVENLKKKKKKEHLKREFHLEWRRGKVSPFLKSYKRASEHHPNHINLAEQGSHKREMAFYKLRATERWKDCHAKGTLFGCPSWPEILTRALCRRRFGNYTSLIQRASMLENHCAAHRSYSLSHKRERVSILTHRHFTIQYWKKKGQVPHLRTADFSDCGRLMSGVCQALYTTCFKSTTSFHLTIILHNT